MSPKTLEKLCCPFDKSDLEITTISQEINGNILEGILHCRSCERAYPIVKGIPIMNPDEYREFQLEKPLLDQWSKHLKGKRFDNFRLVADGKKEIEG